MSIRPESLYFLIYIWKMNSKLPERLIFPLILLVTTQIPGCFCQYPRYEICRQTFQCGYIVASYPFWGGDRPASCGHPMFELNCDGDVPLLNISSRFYRVLEMDYSFRTLRIAREDLRNNLCPTVFYDTTLDFTVFQYSSIYNDQNVTLYYGCGFNSSNNEFDCNNNGTNNLSFYTIGEASVTTPLMCSSSVTVPVNETAAQALTGSGNSSYNVLQDALGSGFSVEWLDVNVSDCQRCMHSGGACGYSRDAFVCYCRDGPSAFRCRERGSKGLTSAEMYVTIGVTLGFAGIFIPSIVIFCYFKKRGTSSDPQKENQNVENFILKNGSLALKRYTYTEIKKITKSFSDKLGQGGFGSVYKGTLPDGLLVAVKVLTGANSNGEDFLNEVASISRTSHVNIVNLLGFCNEKNKRALVYEFMPNTSLDKFICQSGSLNTDSQLGLDKLYNIAVGVARGLEYLHRGCNTTIVHFDIKPQNILLDEDFCPKISDFGLAKLCKRKQSILSVLGTRGTVGYIAPEVFSRNFGSVSHKSDVYSFGMMVLEMAGARKFEEDAENRSSESYFPDKVYEQGVLCKTKKLLDEKMSEEDKEMARKMFMVGFWCIQTVPSDRPSMNKVLEMLEGSVQSIKIPPKPFLASPMLSRQQFSSSFLGTESITE